MSSESADVPSHGKIREIEIERDRDIERCVIEQARG
jgi:hypothetical protein